LHEAHHVTFNLMQNTASYSIYPSAVHSANPAHEKVRVVKLPHKIPICESVSPTSDKKWHGMTDAEIEAYLERLETTCYEYMKEAEEAEGCDVTFVVAHHTFTNPLVMQRVVKRRVREGKQPTPIVSFCHGTALKMYANEAKGVAGYPRRFYPFIQEQRVFGGDDCGVQVVVAISDENKEAFREMFPDFPEERVFVSLNGYEPQAFFPQRSSLQETLSSFKSVSVAGGDAGAETGEAKVAAGPPIPAAKYTKMVLFVGKFADWKRLDAVLASASVWEKTNPEIVTIIAGTGGAKAVKKYHQLAFEKLGLRNTFFVGSQLKAGLLKLFNAANVGVFPSLNEPFGMVFIECMACGTPVVGAASGGPLSFVTEECGVLVPESSDAEAFSASVRKAVLKALDEDWKVTKREACLELVTSFTMDKQCEQIKSRVLALCNAGGDGKDLEQRAVERAYFAYLNGGSTDEVKNYYAALEEERRLLGD